MFLAIIQARMSSTRLPGKVMKTVLGRPIIGYMFERLSHLKMIDKIILATSVNPMEDQLCDYVKSEGFDVFRGSEDDVLERFYLAAKEYNADHIVRATGDCPCIDPVVCDRLFKAFFKEKADYAELSPEYAEGADCEVFTFNALEQAYNNTTLKSEREHVTLYFNKNPGSFKKFLLPNQTDDSKYRFTVDEEEDFVVVKAVFEALYKGKSSLFSLDDIKTFLDSHEGIYQLNNHIIRNEGLQISLDNDCSVKEA